VATPVQEDVKVSQEDAVILEKLFVETWKQPFVKLEPARETRVNHPPIRLGVVLSGGQAPGGHNVISGIFDYVKSCNPNSQLFGFLNGPWGIFSHKYMEISEEYMARYRNQGGFDMICSGRHKIESDEDKQKSLAICQKLDLQGLVIVGGDDSNTNGAILADYFKTHGSSTKVIGVPKTIDGDLKNEFVEASFGFDTAVKVYSELIGNLSTDVGTSQNRYHFVRLMGRSASNIAMECALQTRPNLTFIGEEVQKDNRSLQSLAQEIVDMVIARHKKGMNYGIVLVPEGLIEFIPEVGVLIKQINDIVAQGEFDKSKLTSVNLKVFDSLPTTVQQELLLERDPHGNVQVAKIATEKLLSMMTQNVLDKCAPECCDKFIPTMHYFGYEGRCAMPSNFDANYCYALGHTAGALVNNGVTACMAVVRDLHKPADEWQPAGCPVAKMMNIERRKGKEVPVIKKYIVELDGKLFQSFKEVRDEWKINNYYRNPGPIQFEGAAADFTNYTIVPPTKEELLPALPDASVQSRYHFAKSMSQLSPLQQERLNAPLEMCPLLRSPNAAVEKASRYFSDDQQNTAFVTRAFPLQCKENRFTTCNIFEKTSWGSADSAHDRPMRVGVALCGQQAPGAANVVLGLVERMNIPLPNGTQRGKVFGFKGIDGLLKEQFIELEKKDLSMYANQGGFEMLGRTEEAKAIMRTVGGMQKVVATCKKLKLDGLVMIGGQTTLTDAALLTEEILTYEQQHGTDVSPKTSVIGVPANQENNCHHPLLETCLGFDSTSKAFAALVGNLLTDAASATKYWYFVRLMGQTPSHIVLESALQTHPNFTVLSEKYASENETLQDVVQDIADVVCARSEQGKNFGTVLVPEGLVYHLPQLRQLIAEVGDIVKRVMDNHSELAALEEEFVRCDIAKTNKYQSQLTPWSLAVLKTLPEFFREQLVKRTPSGRIELSEVGTEQLLSVLVSHEMKRRKKDGSYKGSFSPVCHYFGFQGRSTMPSQFDCCLGLTHGYLAGITVEAGLTGHMNSIRGLCGPPATWKMTSVPIACLLKVMPDREMKQYGRTVPMVPLAEVDLQGKPNAAFQSAVDEWEGGDHFCNPGPIQFAGAAAYYHNRSLHEEQYRYLQMLGQLEGLTCYISQVCGFGVDASTLRTAVLSLEALQKILQSQQGENELCAGL